MSCSRSPESSTRQVNTPHQLRFTHSTKPNIPTKTNVHDTWDDRHTVEGESQLTDNLLQLAPSEHSRICVEFLLTRDACDICWGEMNSRTWVARVIVIEDGLHGVKIPDLLSDAGIEPD